MTVVLTTLLGVFVTVVLIRLFVMVVVNTPVDDKEELSVSILDTFRGS